MGFPILAHGAYLGPIVILVIGLVFLTLVGGSCAILFMVLKRHLGHEMSENTKWIYLAIFGITLLCQLIWLGALWSLQS